MSQRIRIGLDNEVFAELKPHLVASNFEIVIHFNQTLPKAFDRVVLNRLDIPDGIYREIANWVEDLEEQLEECRGKQISEVRKELKEKVQLEFPLKRDKRLLPKALRCKKKICSQIKFWFPNWFVEIAAHSRCFYPWGVTESIIHSDENENNELKVQLEKFLKRIEHGIEEKIKELREKHKTDTAKPSEIADNFLRELGVKLKEEEGNQV